MIEKSKKKKKKSQLCPNTKRTLSMKAEHKEGGKATHTHTQTL